MTRIYREMWEGAPSIVQDASELTADKKTAGRVSVKKAADKKSDYITINIMSDIYNDDELKAEIVEELALALEHFIKKYNIGRGGRVLTVGLGNAHVTADSLGCAVCDKLIVTGHLYDKGIAAKWGNLACIKPSVGGVTGLDSYGIIKAVAENIRPDLIIAVDTLACGRYERLARNIQISDDGIEPGAGVGNPKPKLNYANLGIPVVAVGVPLVIYISRLIASVADNCPLKLPKELADLVVTAKEIDFQVSDYSDMVAQSINKTVHSPRKNFFYP